MFSIVVKNSILIILVVFILHFMIINHVNDVKIEYLPQTITQKKHMQDNIPETNSHINSEKKLTDNCYLPPNNVSTNLSEKDNKFNYADGDFKDLYKFVYDEDPLQEKSDSNFKTNDKPSEVLYDKQSDLNMQDTCSNEVDSYLRANKKNVTSNNSNGFTIDGNHPILFEYENDNSKTGVNGYESYGSTFMQL
jgi:hypothetical protein